jgi:hypothetical protein
MKMTERGLLSRSGYPRSPFCTLFGRKSDNNRTVFEQPCRRAQRAGLAIPLLAVGSAEFIPTTELWAHGDSGKMSVEMDCRELHAL